MFTNFPKLLISIHTIEDNKNKLHLKINDDFIVVFEKNQIGSYQLEYDISIKWQHTLFEFVSNNIPNNSQLVYIDDNNFHVYNIENHCIFIFSLKKNVLTIHKGSQYIIID
jgi:hypothetical protein